MVKLDETPFVFGKTVSVTSFTNREEETEKLKNNLLNGINTIIISPRRWGKSSLVEKVVLEIQKEEIKTVVIDLFTISSEEEFLEIFAREVIKSSSKQWEDWLSSGKKYFKNLIPKLSVGIDPTTDFSLSFDWKEINKHKDEILNLPEQIAKEKNMRFVICIDEFQNLANFKDFENVEKKMRSIWQRQKQVTYCLFGSNRHMMTDIFNSSSKPFYRFGDLMLLQKIKKEKWVDFICESFQKTNKIIDRKYAEKIADLMKNHSWYVQQLSHYVWTKTYKKSGIIELNNSINELINSNTPFYQKEVETISGTQLNLLKAVVFGETQFTSTAVMEKYKLGTPRNVQKNKGILVKNDIIQDVNGRFELVDPAFELWFKKQYFNISYEIQN